MPDPISAALVAFGNAAKSIVNVRKGISSLANLLDDRQIDQIRKSIRSIYFFQGGFISDIDRLLSRSPDKKAVAQSIRQKLDVSEQEVRLAVAVLTQESLTTNLRLDLEEIDAIRQIADLKLGIRQHLRNLVTKLEVTPSLRGLTVQLKEIRAQIAKICLEIDKIEKLLARRGLQQAKE